MIIALLALGLGWLARGIGGPVPAHAIWMAGLAVCALPVVARMIRDAAHGRFATDIVAALAIIGALLLGVPIAGLVVVLMLRGGEALERYAEGKASQAVRALEEAAPRLAHRVTGHDTVDVEATSVAVDEILLVRPGELIPCDGVVTHGESDIDTSTLTGEPIPVVATVGTRVMSGSLNGAGVLHVRATARAAESQYARIVELVRTAQSHKAPLQRMADRYATWFTPLTLVICAIAFVASRDWTRVLAVLVVATPCPLILATPVAFVGGVNRAARHHIIIRSGGALETLSRVTAVLLDKTGTITLGEPMMARVRTVPGCDEDGVLELAASVEQGSSHRIARTIVREARARGLPLRHAVDQREQPGQGATAIVDGRPVRLGSRAYVLESAAATPQTLATLEAGETLLRAYVAVDGDLVASFEYEEQLRDDVPAVIDELRKSGVTHVALLSGDRVDNVRSMAARAGIADVRADLMPADKATIVQSLQRTGEVVMMVGDGTNDAPALAAADVGVALAGHGGGVTAEAADVILLRDTLDSVPLALRIGRDTTRIARQSIAVGLGLSGAAMAWAALGHIQPVFGAILQEAIDVVVIVNALRTTRGSSA